MGQYIGFNIGREEYVVPILIVQEIMKPTQTTVLPHSRDFVMGIISLRGKTITVIDLKQKLGLFNAYSQGEGNVIVINMGRITFGVKVDSITGVMNIDNDSIVTEVGFVGTNTDECLKGVANLGDDRMVLVLDFTKLLTTEEISLIGEDIVNSECTDDGEVVVTKRITTMGGDFFVKEVKDAVHKSAADKGLDQKLVIRLMENVNKLMESFANGDIESAERAIDDLSSFGDREMFSEIGRMTRKLHDSIKDFKQLLNPKLKTLAEGEMSEATDKLEWVITKTEESANKTINIAEKNQAKIDELLAAMDNLESSPQSEETAAADKDFSNLLKNELYDMNNDFLEIMMAQEFQDLTGQILRKVIKLVRDLEDQLVKLVMMFGVKVDGRQPEKPIEKTEGELLGPQIKPSESAVSDQGDVDALLAEFGF
ncbi:MAG: protein phosphatase CheZ [Nitrospirae bacterium]|nr:protein phosphatase CheZ [Nitrospirota bacterium]